MASGRIKTNNPEFLKEFDRLCAGGKNNRWTVWTDFIFSFACAISNSVDKTHFDEREAMYLRTVKKYTKEELDIFPSLMAKMMLGMEDNPNQDFLGELYMQLDLGNPRSGQFFTPYDVCRAMSMMTNGDVLSQVNKSGYITINDCACGAGATLIAFANTVAEEFKQKNSNLNWQNHILFTAQDIDVVTGLMCYIQLSLLGCAGFVKIADTILHPMCESDTKENYWFTPMYYSEVWRIRRTFRGMSQMFKNNQSAENSLDVIEVREQEKTAPAPLTKSKKMEASYDLELTVVKDGQISLFDRKIKNISKYK